MFDKETTDILRSAPPAIKDLNPEDLPLILTEHYTELVSKRLQKSETDVDSSLWPLETIADVYEFLAVTINDYSLKKSSAFVAATAHQIMARRNIENDQDKQESYFLSKISREYVAPDISASILFLLAEQFADAHEASKNIIPYEEDIIEVKLLTLAIKNLSSGNLVNILDLKISGQNPTDENETIEQRAFREMVKALFTGVKLLAYEILGNDISKNKEYKKQHSSEIFQKVYSLSTYEHRDDIFGENKAYSLYPGIHHLSSLLMTVLPTLLKTCLTKITPPAGNIDNDFWSAWIKYRAQKQPYLWPNHKEAISKRFYDCGKSAFLVLPTGSGKTTVSSIKIAACLASGKSVVFLAPTHALVEQMTDDLQKIFPESLNKTIVRAEPEISLLAPLPEVATLEVMTPERCLTLVTFAPEIFADVGLLVFDECHLLSPSQGNFRRALDGMLCILSFNNLLPEADFLFLSAMVKNSKDFSMWIEKFTGRPTVNINLLWKPSRQARGVIVYKDSEVKDALASVKKVYTSLSKKPKGITKAFMEKMKVYPYAVWGLEHNWNKGQSVECTYTKIHDNKLQLGLNPSKYNSFYTTANVNEIASEIAVTAMKGGLKVIVFVNRKSTTYSVAKQISAKYNKTVILQDEDNNLWKSLEVELGGLEYSVISKSQIAVPHNSSMLKIERKIAEKSFKRETGASVIVATPTISQGLNLPAHFVILAGDTRHNTAKNSQEPLNMHELLNAAARAGRAGHLANGIVLLIPSTPLYFTSEKNISNKIIKKLSSILPEQEQCVTINDPLEIVLDRIMQGDKLSSEVTYALHRFATISDSDGTNESININNTLASYIASMKSLSEDFTSKIIQFRKAESEIFSKETEKNILIVSSQSGIPCNVLEKLQNSLYAEIDNLPDTVTSWVNWFFDWLMKNKEESEVLLCDALDNINKITNAETLPKMLKQLLPAIHLWISGKPFNEIEQAIIEATGKPFSQTCESTRLLVLSIIPRGLTFSIGIVSQLIKQSPLLSEELAETIYVIDALSPALRLGYDTPEKLLYAHKHGYGLSRVGIHKMWIEEELDNDYKYSPF